MSVVSNLYAAKLYSEHPIAIWPLDDDVSYISLISNTQRGFQSASPYAGWTITNGTANDSLPLPDEGSPFISDIYAGIQGVTASVNGTVIQAKSPDLFLFNSCNQDLETFCISMYVYQSSDYIDYYEFGYEYYDNDTTSWIEVTTTINALDRPGWIHLQDTFVIQEFDADYCHVIFRAVVNTGGTSGDYDFIINGITVGQWSENFTSESLGATKISSPVSASLSLDACSADQYGILSDNAYYLVENGKLLAKNQGVPMIYGSENVTRLYNATASGNPSMIFPNKKMFTDAGRYKNYTLESWIRLRPITKESRRIIGPIDTDDGIYVQEGFITLVINKQFVSHNISEWYRPMLLHLIIKDETISMVINGEQVGQLDIGDPNINLSETDWLGFYTYSDFDIFEIDCVSIFPYAVPLQVAKKRFVWGQGTDPIELINDSFDGEEASIQFINANYKVNYVYPDKERWDAGYYNNIIATTNSISVPQYSLPEINIGGRDITEWYEDNNIVNNAEYSSETHPKFFTFRPNQVTRTNLIINPSFETNTASWTGNSGATITRSTSEKYIGTASCLVTQVASNYSGIILSPSSIPVTSGNTYTLSVYVKGITASQSLILNVHQLNSGGSIVTQSNSGSFTLLSSDGWVRKSITFTAASGVVSIRPMMIHPSLATAGNQFYIDGFLFEQASTVLPYFDGSYADPTAKAISTYWSGTPNLSTSTMSYWTTTGSNWTEQAYLLFPTLSFLNSPLSAIYGIFEVEQNIASSRPLIHIVNTLTNKRFEVNINGYNVTYKFNGQELAGTGFTVDNTHFVVGFHIPTLIKTFTSELASFFGSPEILQMLVGGNGTTTFESKIYRIGFSDQLNFNTISEHFDADTGIADYQDDALLEAHYASYTLSPFFRYNTYFLDISVYSQWEEYFPLSSFASYITTRDGSTVYDLDYLQVNYGYPSLVQIVSSSVDNANWTYQQLFEAYNDPIQKSYEILDNELLSGYANYAGLASNIITEYQIDTTGSSMDAYVTFQLLAEGADEPLSSFTYTKLLTDSYTVYAENENTNANPYKAYKTKFPIIDGTIIYPPKKIDFKDVAMVVHFIIQQDGIISNPLKVKNLEITSRCLNQNDLTPIGTKSGMPIYPYVKTGIYYSGKSKNPVMIGKDSLPYLYLTEKTGIKIMEDDAEKEYGVIVPINLSESDNYSLGAVQLFLKYDVTHPVGTPQPIFNLIYPDGVIEFVLAPDETAERFYIYARDQISKQRYTNIEFFLNGISVIEPHVMNKEWNVLAFSFPAPINFSEYAGSINLLHGCWFDNISYFKSSGLNEFSIIIPRNWSDVLYNDDPTENPSSIVDWQYWYNENGVLTIPNEWKDVYVLDESISFSTTPKDIYSAYVGTNIIVMDDNTGMSIVNDDFTMFADQTWLSIVQKPA